MDQNTNVRAKFTLISISEHHYGGKELTFQAIYDTSTEENRRFTKATPSGRLTMTIDNPAAFAQFQLGKHYYADFSAAE